ncbi:TPA: CehA/McbA family metallohydrolase, partial [archaeon]|nr:CehA/McbA family metallohydrolase [Candidatus Naiadarchaeum limnaeum]
ERYRHFLAIGIENYIPGDELEANGKTKTLSPKQLVEKVKSQGGAGYVAHPFYEDPFRQKWKEEDYNLPFTGLQIWNFETWEKDQSELEKGLQKWKELLAKERKVFIGAGSDSHGDWQILGKARTYVYTNTVSQSGILEALKNGNSFITDGPVITVWIGDTTFGQEALIADTDKVKMKIQLASNLEFGRVSEIEIWNAEELEEVLRPNKYFEPELIWDDKFLAEDTYYRFVAHTENGYTAYTNPIWVKTFSKPRAEVVKKEEKVFEKITKFISPIVTMPSIIVNIWFDPIHKKEPREILEQYKTDEMRKIDKITSDALKKLNQTSGPSISEQRYTKSGQVSSRETEKTEKDYIVERHGGKVYYPE